MLWTILVILIILWLIGFGGGYALGSAHIFFAIAVIILVVLLINNRRRGG